MDYLYTPWRYQYISSIKPDSACIFCLAAATPDGASPEQRQSADRERLVLFRGQHTFVILNLYPYTNGHLMIAPYPHVADLSACPGECLLEMMELAQRAESALKQVYRPDGFNVGLNLGRCAGAGVEGHLHLHVVPRWVGDASFLSVLGETRQIPETLETTYKKLHPLFR